MKTVWSGSLSFGLINIPIHVYSAIQEHRFGFRVLCAKCHHPIQYKYWCPHCKKEVVWNNTVKGFKQENGTFAILTKETIKALKAEKTSIIDIKEFVNAEAINPIYSDNHYYALPAHQDTKAFFLFLKALQKTDKVAVGIFVMHEKEHIVSITPYENILLLNTLHYSYEIRDLPAAIKVPKVSTEELKLAQELIAKLSHKTFNIAKYKNRFVAELKKELATLKKGKQPRKIAMKKTVKHKPRLTETLRKSIHAARA